MKNLSIFLRLLIVPLLYLLACRAVSSIPSAMNQRSTPAANLLSSGYLPLKSQPFEAVIVPQEQASDFIYSLTAERPAESWTPTEEDILELEEYIKLYLDDLPPNTLMPLEEYQRQYAGGVINDHRLLYGNFFCQTFDFNWHKMPLVVMDGGNCFFHVIFDLQSKDFVAFNINGEG